MPLWLEITMASLGLVAAAASAWAAYLAWNISKAAFEWQKQKDGPEVRVSAQLDDNALTFIYLIIENVGRSAAYDIAFDLSESIPMRAFGPVLGETPEERREHEERLRSTIKPMESGPLINGLPALAAGDRRVILWGQYGGLKSWLNDRYVHVNAMYVDKDRIPFSTLSILEVKSFETEDVADNRPEKKIANALEQISRDLKRCLGV